MGRFRPDDDYYIQYFDQTNPLTGFVGYESSDIGNITAIGFYRYKCYIPPPEPEEELEEEPEEKPEEEQEEDLEKE